MSIARRKPTENSKGGFSPPHCPRRTCPFYSPHPQWRYQRKGLYIRRSDRKSFPKFRCSHCHSYFSTRAFSSTYYLRYRSLLPLIANLAVNGPALRQIARILHISHSTAARHLARAARHCLLLHQELTQAAEIAEPLVIDGFESFEFSQFFPFHLNLAVGKKSWFLYRFTASPLRRKGSMTPKQKEKRSRIEKRLGTPSPKAVEDGIVDLLRPLLPRIAPQPAPGPELARPERKHRSARPPAQAAALRQLELWSDEHPAYPRALRRLRREEPTLCLLHRTLSSKARRTTSNPLFAVNLADLLLRHSEANHRRETIAFSKRLQCALERLAVFALWRNWVKRRREREAERTAAMEVGVARSPWAWERVFRRRRFVRRELLPGCWWQYYWAGVKTPALGASQREHSLRFAF